MEVVLGVGSGKFVGNSEYLSLYIHFQQEHDLVQQVQLPKLSFDVELQYFRPAQKFQATCNLEILKYSLLAGWRCDLRKSNQFVV